MSNIDCVREPEVLDSLASRQWPQRCDADLVGHVRDCPVCRDVVIVTSALIDARETCAVRRQLPGSGVVWWRAQVRARTEDARTAAAPITLAHGAGIVTGAAAALLLLGLGMGWLQSWGARLASVAAAIGESLAAWRDVSLVQSPSMIAVVLSAWLVLAPVAVYLLFVDD